MVDVNAHLHTPYSFSAFSSVSQALEMASKEGVKVVGINDFYSTDGYAEWNSECAKRGLFPLFNIEMIALSEKAQAAGVRVNDPNNPGRTYLSGKGLRYPVILSGEPLERLEAVKAESNAQVERMCGKLNAHLASMNAGFTLSYPDILRDLCRGSVRERHLAKALRLAIEDKYTTVEAQSQFYRALFGGADIKSDLRNAAAVENEIRSKLLKAGGAAFVPEDPKAFLPVETVIGIIKAAGGIPTYPFLADDAKGNFTDFEADLDKCIASLREWGISSVEFITTRNTTAVLEDYASRLEAEGFVVSFGSEHNTPALEPVRLRTRDCEGLSDKLRAINYRGACAIAANEYGLEGGAEAGHALILKTIGND